MSCHLPDPLDPLYLDWLRRPEARAFRESGLATGITPVHWARLAETHAAPLRAGPEDVLQALEAVVAGADVDRTFIWMATRELASWWRYLGRSGWAPHGLEVAERIREASARDRLEVATASDEALATLRLLTG